MRQRDEAEGNDDARKLHLQTKVVTSLFRRAVGATPPGLLEGRIKRPDQSGKLSSKRLTSAPLPDYVATRSARDAGA